MFELTKEEHDALKQQFGARQRGAHSKYKPFAFTEQGVAMLSSVLNSDRAIMVTVSHPVSAMKDYPTIRLHPRISLISNLPSTSKLSSECSLPISWVEMNEHEWILARSIILIPPDLPSGRYEKGS